MAKILIAEDRDDAAELLRQLLTRQGHGVDVTDDGQEAVARHAEGGYQLVILDAAMPNVDGFTAAGEIRKVDAETPILMITAHTDPITRAHARRVEIDHLMFKPYEPADVIEAVEYLLKHGRKWLPPRP